MDRRLIFLIRPLFGSHQRIRLWNSKVERVWFQSLHRQTGSLDGPKDGDVISPAFSFKYVCDNWTRLIAGLEQSDNQDSPTRQLRYYVFWKIDTYENTHSVQHYVCRHLRL